MFQNLQARAAITSALTVLVFAVFDLLDWLLCFFYRLVDRLLDGHAPPCYCSGGDGDGEEEEEPGVSETLRGRRNLFRKKGRVGIGRGGGKGTKVRVRWSDCGCPACVAWQEREEKKLHFVAKQVSQGDTSEFCQRSSPENVIFLHGFMSSSSFWVESVFKNLSEHAQQNCRLFAVDLLGFGESPKPADCLYRLQDHVEMIETTIIRPLNLKSFHLVSHSMGCIIAIALAAKYKDSIKTVTLVAPPYFPSIKEKAGHIAFHRLAGKRLWPPTSLGCAVMSWYEHLGRTVCFIVCRNHRKWEFLLKLITRKRNLHFTIIDMTRHTHHSAWHTMHNVICGGAKFMDEYLEDLNHSQAFIKIVHGSRDQVVPLECSLNMNSKLLHSKLQVFTHADHDTVIFSREKEFTKNLEDTWFSHPKHE